MSDIVPVHLEKTAERELVIESSDGLKQTIPFRKLRKGCQCATCGEERKKQEKPKPGVLPILSAAEARPLDIEKMAPVGNYAYNISFSDGHSTGIFTFDYLRTL